MTVSSEHDAVAPQQRCVDLLFAGRMAEAFAEAKAELRANSDALEPLLVLAAIAAEHRNFNKAIELASMSLHRGETAWAHVLLGRSELAMHRFADARRSARAASELPIVHPEIADMVGVLLARTGFHHLSVPFFRAAVAAYPEHPSYLYNLAAALQFAGDLDEAASCYRAVLRSAPDHHRAWLALVSLEKQSDERNQIAELEDLFAASDTAHDRGLIGHALAKTYEDLGAWDRSFEWLETAKAGNAASSSFDGATLRQLVEASIRSMALVPSDAGPSQDAPIFIVGMPRSGTTLVERMLGSHSAVASAGELSDFAVLLKKASATPGPLVLDPRTLLAARDVDLAQVGRDYLASAREIVGEVPRFIDKMPFNIFYVPAILAALPGAKVICLRRDPADTLLSNFRQLFATDFPYYDYAFTLDDSAAMVAGFERLADRYRAELGPERYMEIRYEEIVGDVEASARRLLRFCDLGFEEACIRPELNASPVATASSAQVRKAVYSSSIGRWRRYPNASRRIVDALQKVGIEPTV